MIEIIGTKQWRIYTSGNIHVKFWFVAQILIQKKALVFFKIDFDQGFGDMKATEMIKQKWTWLSKMQMKRKTHPKLTKTNLTYSGWGHSFNESERYAYII